MQKPQSSPDYFAPAGGKKYRIMDCYAYEAFRQCVTQREADIDACRKKIADVIAAEPHTKDFCFHCAALLPSSLKLPPMGASLITLNPFEPYHERIAKETPYFRSTVGDTECVVLHQPVYEQLVRRWQEGKAEIVITIPINARPFTDSNSV